MRHRERGLTLIELLVVLVVLAVASGAAVTLTDRIDLGARYQESANRLAEIRAAILGPDAVGSDGRLLSGGYLQDVGWMPADDADLLRLPTDVTVRAFDSTWRTWYGWAGPYVAAPPKRSADADSQLFDGFGGDFSGWPSGTPWTAPLVSGAVAIQSLGSDGVAGGTEAFARDLPDATQPLIPESEWVTDMRSWSIRVTNSTGTAIPLGSLRFKVVVPRWDQAGNELGFWPTTATARDNWEHYGGAAIPTAALPLNPGDVRTFSFGTTSARRVPNGRRQLFVVFESTGSPFSSSTGIATEPAELQLTPKLAPPAHVDLVLR